MEDKNMKKLISAVLSASLAVSSMGVLYASAAEVYGDGSDIVIFGDSIAEGYDLAENEYNYGQIIADYIGGTVSNYAKAGDETSDTLAKISTASDLANADVVIISSGANDMIHYSTMYMLKIFAQNNLLNGDYNNIENIPANPTFDQMMNMINITSLKEYLSKSANQIMMKSAISKLEAHLKMVEGDNGYQKYDRVIETRVIPNIEKMVSDIRAVNPNARIILQTVYNPTQLEESYLAKYSSYSQFVELLKPVFESVINVYNSKVSEIEGVEIADVCADFDAGNQNTWYFTGFQDANVKEFKVHPNQAGHIAIAVDILNILGEKSEDGGLLNLTYERLDKKDSYPAAALSEYNKVAGTYVLGNPNGDSLIDASDATEILAEYSRLSTGGAGNFTDAKKKAADVTGDGNIDSNDASSILAYYSYASTGGTGSLKYYMLNK